jgi:hypothetical protein
MSNVPVKDYHDIVTAVTGKGPKPIPSHVGFDVRWHGHGSHKKIHDKTFGFEGQYVTGGATITFTTSHDGGKVVYNSKSAGQYNPTVKQGGAGSPAVGSELNGIFFS